MAAQETKNETNKDMVLLRLDKLRGRFNVIVDQLDKARRHIQQTENCPNNMTYKLIVQALDVMEQQISDQLFVPAHVNL